MIELIRNLKNLINSLFARGTVALVDDSKGMQTLQAEFLADETFDKMERFQEYGFSSVPKNGAELLALFRGGRRDSGVVIKVDDRRYRIKALKEGEVAIYTDEGDSIILKRGNKIEVTTKEYIVKASTKIHFEAPLFEIVADQTTTTGKIKANLDVETMQKLISAVGVFAPGYNGPTAGNPVVATGNIETSGEVKDSKGTMEDIRAIYNNHTHVEKNGVGGNETMKPTQGM